jgi:hypothetical protein
LLIDWAIAARVSPPLAFQSIINNPQSTTNH